MAKRIDPRQGDIFESDTRFHEYAIVLHPDWTVSNKVKSLKQLLKAQINRDPYDLHTRPHITLYDCRSTVCQDSHVENQVRTVIKKLETFTITISGVDYWDTGTFFLRIQEPKAIQQLAASIKQSLTLPKYNQEEAGKGSIPHLTISRFITKKEMAQLNLSDFELNAAFNCNAITILKKAEGELVYRELVKLRFG